MNSPGVVRGVAWSTIQSLSGLVLGFGVFVILARLLTPAQIGLVAVAGMFIDIANTLSRAGIAEAVVQRQQLDDVASDTAFWMATGNGVVMALLFWLGAPLLSMPFRMPELTPILHVLAISFVISGLSAAQEARLTRALAFRTLALRGLISSAVSGAVAIGMALTGWGVWSLVAQRLVSTVISAALCWRATGWVPGFQFSVTVAKSLLSFGSRMLGTSLVQIANGRIHEVIAALFLDAAAVGQLRIGWRCMDLIMKLTVSPAASVAMPVLSRLQDEPEALQQQVLSLVKGTAVIAYPAFIGFAAVAPVAIPLIFGPQWTQAAHVTQLLLLLVIPAVPNAFAFPALAALGRAQWGFAVTLVQVAVGGLMSLAAAPFGLVAMAASHVLRAYILWPLAYSLLSRATGLRITDVMKSLTRPFLATAAMAAVAVGLQMLLANRVLPVVSVAAVVAAGVATYGLAAWLLMPDLLRAAINRFVSLIPRRWK